MYIYLYHINTNNKMFLLSLPSVVVVTLPCEANEENYIDFSCSLYQVRSKRLHETEMLPPKSTLQRLCPSE